MDPRDLPVLSDRTPAEVLVQSSDEACPYIEGETARMPLRMPVRALAPTELDARLANGDRRHGLVFYRPECPRCQRCEAIRLPVEDYVMSRSDKRVLRRGDAALTREVTRPRATAAHLALYEKHKRGRGLAREGAAPTGMSGYRGFLVDRCCDTLELSYSIDGALVGVAIADVGAIAMSAVYCSWDPDHADLAIGRYSILKQIELCRERGITYLYLGLYIADNAHMVYKGRFLPHERRVEGTWRRYDHAT